MKENQILGKKILLITAHPDDETFLAGGTIYANSLAGGTTTLYTATAGERGTSYMENPGDRDQVKELRMKELEKAAKYLSIDKVIVGSFPDREISNYLPDIESEIIKIIKDTAPDTVLGFNENGYTGHEDHIAMGVIAKKVCESLGIPYASFSHPPKAVCQNLNEHLSKKRSNGLYKDEIFCEAPNVCIPIDPQVKMQALQIYASQFTGLNPNKIFPPLIAEHFLSHEYFYLED